MRCKRRSNCALVFDSSLRSDRMAANAVFATAMMFPIPETCTRYLLYGE
jgi:hypothetical protein